MLFRFFIFISVLWSIICIIIGLATGGNSMSTGNLILAISGGCGGGLMLWWFLYWVLNPQKDDWTR